MHPRSRLLLLAAAIVLAACSNAAPTVSGAWVRPASTNGVSAAYFTITASPGAADSLVSATSPAAAMVMLHDTTTDGTGMTGMVEMTRADIPAGTSVAFAPGGRHLMLTGLTGPLVAGATIELDLVFEHAGVIVVQAEIRQG
jgi:copper(I)-binding protein